MRLRHFEAGFFGIESSSLVPDFKWLSSCFENETSFADLFLDLPILLLDSTYRAGSSVAHMIFKVAPSATMKLSGIHWLNSSTFSASYSCTPLLGFMVKSMLFACHQFKVFYSVIVSNSVLVMNNFRPVQIAPKMFFHYESMLENVVPVFSGARMTNGTKQYISGIMGSSSFPYWTIRSRKSFSRHLLKFWCAAIPFSCFGYFSASFRVHLKRFSFHTGTI